MNKSDIEKLKEKFYKEYSHGVNGKMYFSPPSTIDKVWQFIETNCLQKQDSDALFFADWFSENYRKVTSKELKRSTYVNYEAGILINGSDFHYTQLIKEHGKTIEECLEIFKSQQVNKK